MTKIQKPSETMADIPAALEWDPDTIQIKGFSKGITEIQWLLVALTLLYLVLASDGSLAAQIPALIGIGVYLSFTLVVNYLAFFAISHRWVMVLQSWAMIAFVTSTLHYTGSLNGPMVNLYLLPVIVSALALGKLTTVLQVAAVAACYLFLLSVNRAATGLTAAELGMMTAYGIMFLLVGYLTIMLADAIHFANHRMRSLARTDQLTGLLNMPTFRVLAHNMYARAVRYSQPFVIIMADMDNLKKINDQRGHGAGDQAVIEIAKRIRSIMRGSDAAARYGGDEFVMFLPDTGVEGAGVLVNRLLQAGAFNRPASDESSQQLSNLRPTLSVGLAAYPKHGGTVEELLDKADKALYQSKSRGGNTMTVYDQESQDI